MQTLSLSVFLAFTICLTQGISKFNISGNTCEQDNALCQNETACNTIFIAFMASCSDIFNYTGNETNPEYLYDEGRCPDDCQQDLDAYLQYLYPNEVSTDYCTCGSPECDSNKQQLYDQRCIASDCEALWQNCLNDTSSCKPLADAYYEACAPLNFFGDAGTYEPWDKNYCPSGCADALDAYVSFIQPDYTSLRFCDCNGNQACEDAKDVLEQNDCATPDCQDLHGDCLADATCLPIADDYLAACSDVINGTSGHSWCPDECKDKLQIYIDTISPGATSAGFCTCSSDECTEGKANLLEVGCVANDCTAHWDECLQDTTGCKPIADAYLEACTDVLNGTWTENWCPADCKEKLAAYIEIALTNVTNDNPLDYCDCNGHIACEEGQTRLLNAVCFNVGCGKLHEIRCTSDECKSDHLDYITSCQSLVNGSWTEPWCPIDCQQNLFSYLTHLVEPEQNMNDIDSICQCVDSNGECPKYFEALHSHGCVTETCQSTWYNCGNTAECKPVAEEYLAQCGAIINGSYTGDTCPDECAGALAAYLGAALSVDALLSDEYCDCQDEASCTEVLARLIELDCIQQSCEYQFATCMADVNCKPFGEANEEHCRSVLNGSETTVCSTDCRSALQQYLNYMYPEVDQSGDRVTDYCTCSDGNEECVLAQGRLNDVGCIDENDCWLNHYNCVDDSTCAPIADAYLTACDAVIQGTYTGTECPTECATKLGEYLDALYGSVDGQDFDGYCNCNNLEQCTTVLGAYTELDCLGLRTEGPTTTAVAEEGTTTDAGEATTTETFAGGSGVDQTSIQGALVLIAMIKVFVM